jgi:hypothetical protein
VVWTGVDGDKVYSVEVPRFRREWRPTSKAGRKIYVIPSHLCLVVRRKRDIKDLGDLRRALALEVEERLKADLWDLKVSDGFYTLAVVRGFEVPQDAYALDPEFFSLARSAKALGLQNCTVVNLHRNRTTFVRVREGSMEAYRVVLRGYESIRRGEEKLEDIVRDSGWDLSGEVVLLGGELADPDDVRGLFKDVAENRYTEPDLITAFGASLRYILPDDAPDFREEEVSPRDLRRFLLVQGTALLVFLGSLAGGEFLLRKTVEDIREFQRDTFRKAFPHLPAVGIMEQLRAMAGEERRGAVDLLLKVAPHLREGMRIYRIEFNGSELRIVGEAKSRDVVEQLRPEVLRRTSGGTYEFEVVVR